MNFIKIKNNSIKKILIVFFYFMSDFMIYPQNKDSLDIYLFKNEENLNVIDLNKIVLNNNPVVTIDDIVVYSWYDHKIVLTKSCMHKIRKILLLDKTTFITTDWNKLYYFVVAVDKKPIYFFWSYANVSSERLSNEPYCLIDVLRDFDEIILYYLSNEEKYIDPRFNKKVYYILQKKGLLIL